jgi:hypothetical protein
MDALASDPGSVAAARRLLVAATLVLFCSFANECRVQVAALYNPSKYPNCRVSGQIIRGIDCHGYYIWLRAPIVHGDWHFDEEYDFYFAHWGRIDVLAAPTETGYRPNMWSVGPAMAWAVTVVPVHAALSAAGGTGVWAPDGYSPPYQLAVGFATFALCLATLFFVFGIARRFAPALPAAAAAAGIVLGTPLVAYGTVELAMGHGSGAAAVAGLGYAWVRTFGSTNWLRWIGIGVLLGVCCLVRWQLALLALLPTAEAIWLAVRATDWRTRFRVAAGLGLAAVFSIVAFTPQMYAWWAVFGQPIYFPHHPSPHWTTPSLWQVLGSTECSLFYWTPLTLVASIGLVWAAKLLRGQRQTVVLTAVASIAIQVYLIASLLDKYSVYLGWAFGFRTLTEVCVFFTPGLAILFDRLNGKWTYRLAILTAGLVAWNLFLLGIYRHYVAGATGGTPLVLIRAVGTYIGLRPLEALGTAALAAWFGRRLVTAFRPPSVEPVSAPETYRVAA